MSVKKTKALYDVVVIPGDGIGPEVIQAMRTILDSMGALINWHEYPCGEALLAREGTLISDASIEAIKRYKYAIKGPIATPIGKGFRSVNVSLRQRFDLYANIRRIRDYKKIDLVIFRENTEDLYIGREHVVSKDEVHAIKIITRAASKRIAEKAFEYANDYGRTRVTAVHKANIMKLSDGLFLEEVRKVAKHYPHIKYDEYIVDNMCMQLVMRPEVFDVIVTENMYGDILSDLCAGLVGGLGLLPGINTNGEEFIFEAVHGSAPDIAGKGLANPIAVVLSAAELLYALGEQLHAKRLEKAVEKSLENKEALTPDLGGEGNTDTLTKAIIKYLEEDIIDDEV